MGLFRMGHRPRPVKPVVQIEFPAQGPDYYKNEFGVYQFVGGERRLIASYPKISEALTAHPHAQIMAVGFTSHVQAKAA